MVLVINVVSLGSELIFVESSLFFIALRCGWSYETHHCMVSSRQYGVMHLRS